MSEQTTTTAVAEKDDDDDLVAAFLWLFGQKEETEPQQATIDWAQPAAVAWAPGGFVLTATQLNATTTPPNLPLAYAPDAPGNLGVGTHPLTASLAPGQTYVAQPKQVSLTVNKLPAKIVWNTPQPLTWAPGGVSAGEGELNAASDPPGAKIAYAHETEGKLAPGDHRITASIAEGEPYEAKRVTQTLTVKKLPAKIVWNKPQPLTWAPGGVSPGDGELNAASDPPGAKIAYAHETEGKLAPGDHRITASIAEGEPYEAQPVVQTLTVAKAKAKIVWDTPAPVKWVTGGFVVGAAQLNAATDPPDLKFDYSGHDGGGKEVGDHTLTAKLNEANYEADDKSVTLKVEKADPQLSWKRAAGNVPWEPNQTVNIKFASNLNNPLNLPLTWNPNLGAPVSIGPNAISVTAADAAHYDQTPQTFTLTIKPLTATVGVVPELEVPADAEGGWVVDTDAVEARTKPPGLAVEFDPPAGTTIYAGNDGITVSLAPTVTNYESQGAWTKVKLVFPPKVTDPGEPDDTTSTKVSKSLLAREWCYGNGGVTPHIHHYGNSYHIKLAGGQRLNLVQNGKTYPDNIEIVRRAVSGRLLAIVDAIVDQY